MSSRVAAALQQRKEQQGSNIAPATATFSSLGIHDWLVEALKALKINRPTEIQRACIPPILAGTAKTRKILSDWLPNTNRLQRKRCNRRRKNWFW